jgi:surface protein
MYGPIGDWDVSRLTSLELAFYRGDRAAWVNSGSDLTNVVQTTTSFNEDISRWNVSAVTSMEGLFAGAENFSSVNLSNWDTSRVLTMRGMFHSASSFNGNLGDWNVVAVQDFSGMFLGCTAFIGTGLEFWDTKSAETFAQMFASAAQFNANVSGWNTDNVVSLQGTFLGCTNFNGTGLETWNTSRVTSMSSTVRKWILISAVVGLMQNNSPTNLEPIGQFSGATWFYRDLSTWQVGRVTDMSQMVRDQHTVRSC